jgi:hypothetical protein
VLSLSKHYRGFFDGADFSSAALGALRSISKPPAECLHVITCPPDVNKSVVNAVNQTILLVDVA